MSEMAETAEMAAKLDAQTRFKTCLRSVVVLGLVGGNGTGLVSLMGKINEEEKMNKDENRTDPQVEKQ